MLLLRIFFPAPGFLWDKLFYYIDRLQMDAIYYWVNLTFGDRCILLSLGLRPSSSGSFRRRDWQSWRNIDPGKEKETINLFIKCNTVEAA